jgi:hypothetical protein
MFSRLSDHVDGLLVQSSNGPLLVFPMNDCVECVLLRVGPEESAAGDLFWPPNRLRENQAGASQGIVQ